MPGLPDIHDAALDALERRALTRRELARRLLQKGFTPGEVDPELERLARAGLLDDAALAYNSARRRAEEGRRGPARVRAELIARGSAGDVATAAVAEAFPPAAADDALDRAARRLLRRGPPATPEARDRLVRRLVRGGFAPGRVLSYLERAGADVDGLDPHDEAGPSEDDVDET